MNNPRTTRKVTIDGRPVHCRVLDPAPGGSDLPAAGLPLLLIHGIGCSADAWVPTLDYLEHRGVDQPIIAPDMPGYGCSPGPPEALGIAELADWTARLMDALRIERAHVLGNSMGCQVALSLARRHPGRVGGTVLVGPAMGNRAVPTWRYLAGLFLDGAREPLAYHRVLLRMFWQMGLRRYLGTIPKMLADRPLDYADEIAAPCLVVRGERDAIVPAAIARRLASALPQGAYATIPGVAHVVQFSVPELFVPLAVGYLARAAQVEPSPPRSLHAPGITVSRTDSRTARWDAA